MGHLRFFLSILVVFSHLAGLAGSVGYLLHLGIFAVFGFYLLSGFLITRILNETYSFNFYQFALNRFLRIYPVYYVVAFASLLIVVLSPSSASFHPAWHVRHGVMDLLGNVLIFPFEFYAAQFRLSPSTWSVAVELIGYFLIWLAIGRSKRIALLICFLSALYHLVSACSGQDWSNRYFPTYAAVLPFSLGSAIYFFRSSISTIPQSVLRTGTILSLCLWIGNMILCASFSSLGGQSFDAYFYVNLILLLALVSFLSSTTFSSEFHQQGKMLGDLAYPIFLTHWIVGFVMSRLVFGDEKYGSVGFSLLAASLPPILLISIFLARVAEVVVEPLRNRVRGKDALSLEVVTPPSSPYQRTYP